MINRTGKNNPFYGKHHSKKIRKIISKSMKGRYLGEKSPTYKGRYPGSHGYIILRIDGKLIREHRYVMEKHLGRALKRSEDVHHIDGNRQNNELKNLEIIEHKKHVTMHLMGNSYRKGKKLKKLLVS